MYSVPKQFIYKYPLSSNIAELIEIICTNLSIIDWFFTLFLLNFAKNFSFVFVIFCLVMKCRHLQNLVSMLVSQSCLTLWELMDYSPPGSSVLGILQTKILEWVVISFSRVSSWPRDQTQVTCIAGGFFSSWATRETT